MLARIYRPSKTAMQSGRAKAAAWVLEFEPKDARRPDPLMGWTVTSDTESSQVRLTFETKDEAVRYAEQHGIAFQLVDPAPAKRIIKAYADNFAFGRRVPWTH
ncbi:ETC complex I subunit [Phenylobacterium sp. SCN 70-31]|uniref:ETC complex I subunit n=1 Tax=Phenylobacterium sp. SCN 70-31 TaxID=1660129 RepID=UPI0008688862|nr:ETC complex I subunit [Phenylobacterium sp. SCN 70-31]ODT88095.1 MAG: ETC complex I subunit [Phenylobacterium sp. SCN 70-31]